MELDDLDSLMAQFMSLQQTKSNPLSERTLIQLLIKLPSFGLTFYQTTDGNEYITQQALDNQIVQTIKQRGRVTSSELPQIIGVNLDVIQSRLNIVCNKYGLTKVQDKLMSGRYLDQVISNLRQQIQIKGKVTMQYVILDVLLPGVFVRKLVEERIQQLNSELIKDVFVTKQYRHKLRSQLIGLLNGILKPTSLSMLLKKYNIQDESIKQIIEQLIKDKRVNGKIMHDYFIPYRFEQNQKILIDSWLQTNNYIQYSQLQKNFFINKPKEWIKSNFGQKVILLDDSAYNVSSIESNRSNLLSLIKQQGFAQLSKIFPSFTDNDIDILFNQHLKLNHLILSNGYCFDPEWLNKCANVFRQKIIYNLFFKVDDSKNKKKKKSKITLEQMKQLLLESDLVQYNTLQDIEEILYQQLTPKIDQLYKQCTTQLAQAKGVVTANMLKYKKGKTILPSQQRCLKYLNTTEKQLKKSGKQWQDSEFGMSKQDTEGILSILYFDKISPKDWVVENVSWQKIEKSQSKVPQNIISSKYLQKCKVGEVIRLIVEYNQQYPNTLNYPFLPSQFQQFQNYGIHVFLFTIQSELKYVLVDQFLPKINGHKLSISSSSHWPALAEKAYAKLRYCYKGILNVGFSTVFQEFTGLNQLKKISSSNFKEASQQFFEEILSSKGKNVVVGVTEGQLDTNVDFQGEPSGFKSNRSYLIIDAKQVSLNNQPTKLYKIRVNNKCHQQFSVSEEQAAQQNWLKQISKDQCVLNGNQIQSIFKTLYVFGNK